MMRHRSFRTWMGVLVASVAIGGAGHAAWGIDPAPVLQQLNQDSRVAVSADNRSYETLFGALVDLTDPPRPVGLEFNLTTIHPGMSGWDAVAAWAEENGQMAEAILSSKGKLELGLPYGADNVDSAFVEAGLYADVGASGNLHDTDFAWLNHIDRATAWVTAECYRLFEAGETQRALDLVAAHLYVLRQCCNRIFFQEKRHCIQLLSRQLTVLRDMFYLYRESITPAQYTAFARVEVPFLQPDRTHLEMPEGDHIVSEAMIREVIDGSRGADAEKFAEVFAVIQAEDEPLTMFGATRRWKDIAAVHAGLDASLERLQLVYDDWWRRWRVQDYDPILDVSSQFDRTNPVRYAAVMSSVRDLGTLFNMRDRLIMEVNATAVAAGLCAYRNANNVWPNDKEKVYGQFMRKPTDVDPYDRGWDVFKYRQAGSNDVVNIDTGQLRIPQGMGIMWSRGQNLKDDRVETHSADGETSDILLWPPARALAREQGLAP